MCNREIVESWIRVSASGLFVLGLLVHEDESTTALFIESVNMRGAMREVTSEMCKKGYVPISRWMYEATDNLDNPLEVSRQFKVEEGKRNGKYRQYT